MTESECMTYLKKEDYLLKNEEQKYKITVPVERSEYPECANVKSTVLLLPLSIEDEVQTCGTASVLKEFASDLKIPGNKKEDYVVLNKTSNKLEVNAARERYVFHKKMADHKKDILALRKQFDGKRSFQDDDNSELDSSLINPTQSATSTFKARMKQLSSRMSKIFETMNTLITGKNLEEACKIINLHASQWIGQVDEFERNILHLAVEGGNRLLVEALLLAGALVNEPEGCGLTPLMLAINGKNANMVQILLR